MQAYKLITFNRASAPTVDLAIHSSWLTPLSYDGWEGNPSFMTFHKDAIDDELATYRTQSRRGDDSLNDRIEVLEAILGDMDEFGVVEYYLL